MRRAFVHEVSLRLDAGADAQAPGAAVTVELCGHWQHAGPCRWPHLARIGVRSGDELTLRVIFATEPADEGEVRGRIVRALRRGRLDGGPAPSGWTVLSEGAAAVREDERESADRLVSL
jgi:hypothetical protein